MTKLYEANNHILIDTDMLNPIEHSHMAAHMIVSLGGKIHVTSENEEYECQGILIPSGASHVVDTRGERVLVFLYDNTTNVAMQIKRIQPLSEEICKEILGAYFKFCESARNDTYRVFQNFVLQKTGLEAGRCSITDVRILSEGRFSHLFREQVGMTFAAYLIFVKV